MNIVKVGKETIDASIGVASVSDIKSEMFPCCHDGDYSYFTIKLINGTTVRPKFFGNNQGNDAKVAREIFLNNIGWQKNMNKSCLSERGKEHEQ